MTEQKPMHDPVVASLHREIYQLRQALERAERAAGRMACDLQEARELAILSDSFEDAFRGALQRIAATVGMDDADSMSSGQLATDVANAVDAQMRAAQAEADGGAKWRDRALKAGAEAESNRRLYHEHHADVLRLEALVERHGLNAAPGADAKHSRIVALNGRIFDRVLAIIDSHTTRGECHVKNAAHDIVSMLLAEEGLV